VEIRVSKFNVGGSGAALGGNENFSFQKLSSSQISNTIVLIFYKVLVHLKKTTLNFNRIKIKKVKMVRGA